jgi:hypothetical protein
MTLDAIMLGIICDANKPIMLIVVMLNIIMLNVMAPFLVPEI